MNYLQDSSKFSLVSAYVIQNQSDHKIIAKVLVSYPKDGAGRLTLEVTDYSPTETQITQGTASGYGYAKADSAISGLTIGNYTFTNCGSSWENQLRNNGYDVFQVC